MYAKFFKRALDFILSLLALIILSPLLMVLTVLGIIAMKGNPFFVQSRPGIIDKKTGKEKIFKLIKFRTMDNRKNADGELLPDSERLNRYGQFLRSTSFDELLELLNIAMGDMSIVGPRPQLVRDMVFMTDAQRARHTVRPGLTGLAQVSGRNNITWEKKLAHDLDYIENITFLGDVKIIFLTVWLAFVKHDGISQEGMDTAEDLGDYLLRKNKIPQSVYLEKMEESKELLRV